MGANLGDAVRTVQAALGALEELGPIRASALYRTEPQGPLPQPWYVNAVAEVRTELSPLEVLRRCQALERRAGRPERHRRWAPRALDLDVLLFGDRVLASPELRVPHPEFHRRRFVLEPLAELAPGLRDPRTGRTVRELLRNLDDPLRSEKISAVTPRARAGRARGDAVDRNPLGGGVHPPGGLP